MPKLPNDSIDQLPEDGGVVLYRPTIKAIYIYTGMIQMLACLVGLTFYI
jgi:hypothetical protein